MTFKTGRPRRSLILFAAVVVGSAVAVVAHPGVTRASAATPSAQMSGGFLDRTNGDYLRVELGDATDQGAFVLAIPGVGLIWPHGQATVTVESDHSIQLRYDGAGSQDPTATLDPEFGVRYQQQGPGQDATVRLIGQIDPSHGTGSVEAWVNGKHVHVGAAAASTPTSATVAGNAYLAALRAGQWTALYQMSDADLRAGVTESDFAKGMATAPGTTGIVDAVAGTPTVTTSAAGVTYANVPIHLAYSGAPAKDGTLVLIMNGTDWKVFTVK